MILRWIILLIALLPQAFIHSQGLVIFDNQNLRSGAAPISGIDGRSLLSGVAFCGQLYTASDLNQAVCILRPAGTRVQFRIGLGVGFITFDSSVTNAFSGQLIDPFVTATPLANGPATVQMRVWEAVFTTFEAPVVADGAWGVSLPVNVTSTGGGLMPPVSLEGLRPFSLQSGIGRAFCPETPVFIRKGATTPGFQAGNFVFNLSAPAGNIVTIETSTNLMTWFPVLTNLVEASPSYVIDTSERALTNRFYRVREF